MTDINSYIRKYINDMCLTNEGSIMLFYKIKSSLVLNDRENIVFRNSIIPILYLDSFKILNDKVRSGFGSLGEIQMYSIYQDIDSYEKIVDMYGRRDDYVLLSINLVKEFYNMPSLGKIKLMKELSLFDNKNLSNISQLHQNDIDKYNIVINEDYLYNFYQKYKLPFDKNGSYYDESSIYKTISGFMQNVYLYSPYEIFGTIESINKKVFNNIEKLTEILDYKELYIDSLKKDYNSDCNNFNESCLFNEHLLTDVICVYCTMRNNNIIKSGKVYKNEH